MNPDRLFAPEDFAWITSLTPEQEAALAAALNNKHNDECPHKRQSARLWNALESISAFELARVASKHVIGVVGGGILDLDSAAEAIEEYLKAARAALEGT